MPERDANSLEQVHLVTVVYAGGASADLTTNVSRRLKALAVPVEMTARLKAMLLAAGVRGTE
jgi:hypothetical protein